MLKFSGFSVVERIVIALVACMLAACGGSGGSGEAAPNSPPASEGPTQEDLANARASQDALLNRARLNSAACEGSFSAAMEAAE